MTVDKEELKRVNWVLVPVVFVLAIWVLGGSDSSPANTTTPREVAGDSASAVSICEQAIRSASLNADSADIPYSRPIDNGRTWRVLWINDNKLKLQNQYGAMIDVAAQCGVDKQSGRIEQLLVGGENLAR